MEQGKQQFSVTEIKAHEILDHLMAIVDEDNLQSTKNPKTWPRLTPFEKNLINCLAQMIEANLCYYDRVLAEGKLQAVWEMLL